MYGDQALDRRSNFYDHRALRRPKDAGAGEEKARKAAETVAAYENRFSKIEADLGILKWMVGFNLAGTVALIVAQFHH